MFANPHTQTQRRLPRKAMNMLLLLIIFLRRVLLQEYEFVFAQAEGETHKRKRRHLEEQLPRIEGKILMEIRKGFKTMEAILNEVSFIDFSARTFNHNDANKDTIEKQIGTLTWIQDSLFNLQQTKKGTKSSTSPEISRALLKALMLDKSYAVLGLSLSMSRYTEAELTTMSSRNLLKYDKETPRSPVMIGADAMARYYVSFLDAHPIFLEDPEVKFIDDIDGGMGVLDRKRALFMRKLDSYIAPQTCFQLAMSMELEEFKDFQAPPPLPLPRGLIPPPPPSKGEGLILDFYFDYVEEFIAFEEKLDAIKKLKKGFKGTERGLDAWLEI